MANIVDKITEKMAMNYSPEPKLLPTGEFTIEHTPQVRAIEEYHWIAVRSIFSEHLKPLRRKLEDFRLKYGPARFDAVTGWLERINYILVRDGANSRILIGYKSGSDIIAPCLEHQEQKLWNAFITSYSKMHEKQRAVVCCESVFAYEPDYFNFSDLEKLLCKEKYHINESREGTLRSSNVTLHSHDGKHKIKISYCIGIDERGFYVDVKYFAFGLQCGEKRDKFDTVYSTDGNNGRIYHIEAQLPATIEILRPHVLRQINEGKMNKTALNFLHLTDRNIETAEVKTLLQDSNCKINIGNSQSTAQKIMSAEDFRKSITNYDELCENPLYLGGIGLKKAVDFAKENLAKLKKFLE